MQVKYLFIINPVSGKKNKQRIEKKINDFFANEEILIKYTRKSGHGHKIARKYAAQNISFCIAVGGDGTVNEVASALVNTNTALGIIPAGSGNGLANHLGIPHSVNKALAVIARQKICTIDAGKINKNYFFCTCGVGFDARVGHEFSAIGKRGLVGYVNSVFRQFFRYRPKKYIIKIDGREFKTRAFLITVANAGQYGNNVYISPEARIDDGLLDICIMKPFPKPAIFPLGLKLIRRKIDRSPYLELIRGKKISLTGKKRKQYVHYDGEPAIIKGKIKIRIKPGTLKVIVPSIEINS
jgi:YegS/Rv2252/BmrU family lipid kinase